MSIALRESRPIWKSPKRFDRGKIAMYLLFLLPALVLYLGLMIYPSVKAFYVSLFDWSGFSTDMQYIGLRNFAELFHSRDFWGIAFQNTLLLIVAGGALLFAIAFILSGILATRVRGRKLLRGIIFFPTVINPVAVAIMWGFIYNRNFGLLNSLLKAVGLGAWQVTWTSPELLFWAILVSIVWMNVGFFCVILLAAFDRIPGGLIEAATLDGAGETQILFWIKLPLIWDVLLTAVTWWCIVAIKEFALLYAWGGGVDVPQTGATNLAVHMYMNAFGRRVTIYRMGYATAMGVLMFVMVGILVLVLSRVFRRETAEY